MDRNSAEMHRNPRTTARTNKQTNKFNIEN